MARVPLDLPVIFNPYCAVMVMGPRLNNVLPKSVRLESDPTPNVYYYFGYRSTMEPTSAVQYTKKSHPIWMLESILIGQPAPTTPVSQLAASCS